jgi:hypothetical protein
MPIKIVESPEPLTGASGQQVPLLIGSDGLRMLKQELRRYCDQKVSGRSFLIAGHRGSGKTTLVQGSIQETDSEITSEWSTSRLLSGEFDYATAITMRPLFILLQGPNLLPTETSEASDSTNTAATAKSVGMSLPIGWQPDWPQGSLPAWQRAHPSQSRRPPQS